MLQMDLGPKSENGEDSCPEIHDLFSHYNSLYFDNALSACTVYWSDSRIARSAGMCCFVEQGRCEIRLSEPLLKSRSTADLKNTLLHEMVHAYLYVKYNKKDHGYHGPSFADAVNAINSSSKEDLQKPNGGYNVTFSHDFSKGLHSHGVGQWICTSCGDMIEGPSNKKPSAADCIEKMAHDNSCDNSSCHWHRHKILCSGSYEKLTGKRKRKNKAIDPKDFQQNKGDKSEGSSCKPKQTRKRPQNVETKKAEPIIRKCDKSNDSLTSPSIKSSYINHSLPKATQLKVDGDTLSSKILKRRRTYWFSEGYKLASPEKENVINRKKENIPVGPWFAFYRDTESDEDNVKPLINKRTKRRSMEKLAKMKEKQDDTALGLACSFANKRRDHDATPVIIVLDDD